MYTPYVSWDEYVAMGYTDLAEETAQRFLVEASRQVDTLTFNRIVKKGFDNLTDFQQQIIQEVVCEQASFLYENADAISSVFDTYSINSVTMKFGTGFNFDLQGGVPIQHTTYSLLEQTGLCCRIAR